MKRKWWIGIVLLVIGMATLAILAQHATQIDKEAALSPSIIEKKEQLEVRGSIVELNDHVITLSTEEGSMQFEILDSIFDIAKLSLQDTIAITYHVDHEKTVQTAQRLRILVEYEDPLWQMIDEMSLEEKVAQLFMARCPTDGSALQTLEDYPLGGYMLFAENVAKEDKASLTTMLSSYQATANIPLLISIDEEGGTVNRLSLYEAFRGVPFHSPQKLYEEGGMELILSDNEEKADLLLSLGINVNLAPVADVSTDPEDFIYLRTFGKDAQETAEYIAQIVANAKKKGIGTTLKHFPGYGNNADTHTGMAFDERPMEVFTSSDFLPFIKGIEAGADAVLVNHNIVACMDEENPASLSKNVHTILRNQLGFDGVIMSDDLDMDAILEFSLGKGVDSAILALQAGNDLLLTSQYKTQIPNVIEAIKQGEIEEANVNRSVYRILSWKQKLGLLGKDK